MKINSELKDTLLRIKCLGDKFAKRTPQLPCLGDMPNHKNIWRGCYDVWYTEQDKIDAQTMPRKIMQELLDEHLIYEKDFLYNGKIQTLYYVGELGLEALRPEQLTLDF